MSLSPEAMQRFPHLFWTLVKLRYQLIWAQARTSTGRIILLVLVSVFFISLGILIGVIGLGTAVAGVQLGRAEFVTRGVLSGLHVSAVMTGLFFGLGPRSALSEPVLRRFPLTSRERVYVRHLIGLIDPIWFLLATSAFGIAIGLAIVGKGSLLVALISAALFVAAAYLTSVFVLSLVDRLMQSTAGATLLGTLGLAALSFSGLGMAWLMNPQRPERMEIIDRGLHFAPSGLAAILMVGSDLPTGLHSLALLGLWCVVLLSLVGWLERSRAARPSTAAGLSASYDFDNFFDKVASVFGEKRAPLMAKALRYYLRSNRVRMGLASAPVFAFVGKLMSQGNSAILGHEFYFTLAFFSFLGFSGPSSISLNQFGSDGEGVRRYAMLPVHFATPIHAGSLAAVLLGAAVVAPTIALWCLVTALEVEWRMIVMMFGSSLGGLFLLNGLAMWTTILSPKHVEFSNMLSNRLPLGGNLVVAGGMFVVFAFYLVLMQLSFETVLDLWWVFVAFAAMGMLFYLICWWNIEDVAEARRAAIIDVITS